MYTIQLMADSISKINSIGDTRKQIQHQVAAIKTAFKNHGEQLPTTMTKALEENSSLQRSIKLLS